MLAENLFLVLVISCVGIRAQYNVQINSDVCKHAKHVLDGFVFLTVFPPSNHVEVKLPHGACDNTPYNIPGQRLNLTVAAAKKGHLLDGYIKLPRHVCYNTNMNADIIIYSKQLGFVRVPRGVCLGDDFDGDVYVHLFAPVPVSNAIALLPGDCLPCLVPVDVPPLIRNNYYNRKYPHCPPCRVFGPPIPVY